MSSHPSTARWPGRWILLPVLLFSLSGCGMLSWFSPSRPSPKAVAPLAKQAVKVEVDTDWQARLYGTWRLQPYETSNIAVGEGHIYLVDASGHLLCLDLGGKQDWMVRLDGKSARGPTLADGILYVGTDSGKLYAFSAKNGRRLWVTQLDSEVLSPITVSKEAVLAQLVNGQLVDLQRGDGKLDWTFSMNQPSLLLRTLPAPVVHGDVVYAGFADGNLVALNLSNGAELWRAAVAIPHGNNELARMVDIAANPIVDGDRIIAAAYQGNLAAYARSGGSEEWSVPMSTTLTPVLADGHLYVALADGRIAAVDPHSGVVLWRSDVLKGQYLTGITHCGTDLLVSDDAGSVYVFDPRSGHRVGQSHVSSSGIQSAPVCLGQDRFLVLSGAGTLYQLHLRPH
ncbi:outer membrane protein assembly factor BamB [Acidithiobacillus caldus]|uniref:Outer membrane protein assembly factor BamB n=2 Tax=Acidithiobacillus caldus TaxID=33059 RepID=A0A1E7YL94_9PROT|nr:outer membrane protein assembly factor BamB [Acidithiobacillus caldus]OFC32738.1 outer membrane protein assembly factor BamB [Acidithiobacillus caldus]OFC37274.1 outer membrane protein assembly factor BamB [Acidithiobacillus caldus]OFC40359.1 outer membrane protein assembly factor BamB [Acidithiobacillus caldus]WMT47669.1 MAG: outer membrane protein assembly factor BamB [Acidithiobacillus caldus]